MTDAINADAATALAEFRGTPEQASAALAAKAAAFRGTPPINPANAADARARLDVLVKDQTWAAKLTTGNPQVLKEFHDLSALVASADVAGPLADTAPEAPPFETVMQGELSSRNRADGVADLRRSGFDDGSIRQVLDGHPVSHQEHVMAERLREMKLADPIWRANYLAGNPTEKRESLLLSTIINSEIAA